jgi:hypothetical protein
MVKRLHRAQILLEAEQHEALAEFAQREGRSISEVVRKIVGAWMTEQEKKLEWRRRMAARQALQGIREDIQGKYQTIRDDLVVEVRTDLVWDQE